MTIELIVVITGLVGAISAYAGHHFGYKKQISSDQKDVARSTLDSVLVINEGLRSQIDGLQTRIDALELRLDTMREHYERVLGDLRDENRKQNEEIITFRAKCTGCLNEAKE